MQQAYDHYTGSLTIVRLGGQMTAREQEFLEYVQSGGQVETTDWMPDEYRRLLIKFIEMHGNSELMGVLPEREWILRAPTLQRKLALTAKVQDEAGHSQLIYRVVEDLGKPREQCLEDLVSGKAKFHNVFHYPTKTWGDVGIIAWLVDAAAIISQKALLKCSYAPYARIMKKICWEESFHILHGRDVVLTMMLGTDEQRELVQEALNRWWGPLMQFHGNPISKDQDPMYHWRIKSQGNDEARQQFLDGYVPQIWELGLTVPDPNLRKDEGAGRWEFSEPDWDELKQVVTGHGPKTQERLELRRMNREETEWVRKIALAEAA
jgi:ring-1,2-phenylacetyl-CoA epoxidase subunit PaaA